MNITNWYFLLLLKSSVVPIRCMVSGTYKANFPTTVLSPLQNKIAAIADQATYCPSLPAYELVLLLLASFPGSAAK